MPPVDKTYRYRMTMDMTMEVPGLPSNSGAPMGMNMVTDMSMKAVKRTGDVTTLESKMGVPKLTGPFADMVKGQTAGQDAEKTVSSEIDRHYGVHSANGAAAGMASALSGFSFPDHAVKIGESWSVSLDMGKMMGAMGGATAATGVEAGKLPFKYTLTGIQKMGEETDAVLAISADGDVPMSAGGMSFTLHMVGKGASTIDIATGMFREQKMTMDATAEIQGQTMKQHVVQSLVRQ